MPVKKPLPIVRLLIGLATLLFSSDSHTILQLPTDDAVSPQRWRSHFLNADKMGDFSDFRPTSDAGDENLITRGIVDKKSSTNENIFPFGIPPASYSENGLRFPLTREREFSSIRSIKLTKADSASGHRKRQIGHIYDASGYPNNDIFRRSSRRCKIRFIRRLGFPITTCITPTWQRRKHEKYVPKETVSSKIIHVSGKAKPSLSKWAPGGMLYMAGGSYD